MEEFNKQSELNQKKSIPTMLQDGALLVFIFSVSITTIIAILAVWEIFGEDILTKSLWTIAVLGFFSLLLIGSAYILEKENKI